jgi:hypothetical protein
MKQLLSNRHTFFRIKTTGATARSRIICSVHYKILLTKPIGDLCSIH